MLRQQQQQQEQQQQQYIIRRIINHPIYKLIQNLPFDSNALHDIRLRFRVGGIWLLFSTFSENYQRSNPVSKDILFKVFKIDQLIIRVTVHRTDTISIIIGCSSSPVAVDIEGILRLTNALRTVRENLLNVIVDSGQALQNSKLIIPCIMSWLVTLWHFGADASITYTGEKFFASWQVGQNALLAIYSKEWKRKGKRAERRIRVELQESPKKPLLEGLEDKRNMIDKLKRAEMRLNLQLDSFQKIAPELIRKLKLAGIYSIENLAIKSPADIAKLLDIDIDEAVSICNKGCHRTRRKGNNT